MRKHRYSQVPVVDNGEVLGVFSFRSFAQEAASATLEGWTKQKVAPGDLPVDEFLEQFEFARVTEEMSVSSMPWIVTMVFLSERLSGLWES